ncbi:MAG: hypothetical protein V4581_12490 [Bacteroidota bacterium]
MKLKVIDFNFTLNTEWVFKLFNEADPSAIYYIMDDDFYKLHNIKTPVTRPVSDSLRKESIVYAEIKNIENMNIVVKIIDFIP